MPQRHEDTKYHKEMPLKQQDTIHQLADDKKKMITKKYLVDFGDFLAKKSHN